MQILFNLAPTFAALYEKIFVRDFFIGERFSRLVEGQGKDCRNSLLRRGSRWASQQKLQ